MNAPTSEHSLKNPSITMVQLAEITPSDTHIQQMRRARFNNQLLKELAESIKSVGVLQAILVRRSQANGRADRFEIVAGERRWLAAKIAGLKEIPATVRDLSDEQVLEVQLIENLQREGLHELEEAEGYEELMKLKQITADAVGDMVGRSKGYVYARVKLLALCPEARKAFYAGETDVSTALLLARIPHHDLQKQAMKDLKEQREYGDIKNFKEAAAFVRENFMLGLKGAPFDLADEQLLPKAGSCAACPKRTGNQSDLFGDVKDKDTCTDPKCFNEKRLVHWQRLRGDAETKGLKVHSGKDAERLMPHSQYNESVGGGYTRLDARTEAPGNKTVKEVLGKAAAEYVELLQHPRTGALIEIVPSDVVTKALNEKGIKTYRQQAADDSVKTRKKAATEKVDEKLEHEIYIAHALAIHKAAPSKLSKVELLHLFSRMVDDYNFESHDALRAMLGMKEQAGHSIEGAMMKSLEKLSEADLSKTFVAIIIVEALNSYDQREAKKLTERVKVDLKKIDKDMRAAAKTKAAAKVPDAAPKKGKSTKAKSK